MSPFNPIPSFGQLWYILGCVHTIPNSFPCVVWIATVQNCNKSLTHIEQLAVMVLWTGSIQSLEFLKKSWNLSSNFQTWKKFLRFFKVSIDHLFGNLESRKRNYCYGKKSGKSLEFWIQKSVRTLCELNPSSHPVPYPSDMWGSTLRDRCGTAPLRYWNRAEITVLMCEQNSYTVWFSCWRKRYPV